MQDAWEIRVTHRNQALMLSPSHSLEGSVLDTIGTVLDEMESTNVISAQQRMKLLKEMSRRVLDQHRQGGPRRDSRAS